MKTVECLLRRMLLSGITMGLVMLPIMAFAGNIPVSEMDPAGYPAQNTGCLAPGKCHAGVEPIRAHDSEMARQIYAKGAALGDPNGCVVCHGGNPTEEKDAKIAHTGVPGGSLLTEFVTHAGSMWVNGKTCGQCHEDWVYAGHRSIMQTEAGKIAGCLWGWGSAGTGMKVIYGNYDIDDPDGDTPVFGTEEYKAYTRQLMQANPDVFPQRLKVMPATDVETVAANPETAVYTYIRSQCQRCHVGVKGRDRRGDFRGMGCASCHIPYSNEGFYEGGDVTVPREKSGRMLVHSIQASRDAKVVVNGKVYSGIPQETCASCHNRGKRIGMSYQGLMEFPYGTPFTADGSKMPKLHTKYYTPIQDDVHHRLKSREGNPEGGLLCQDCHATTSMHGNGNITGTLLANVEIECADCHGTAQKYPWELPLGFGDEFGNELDMENGRGTADSLPSEVASGMIYPMEDGYILSARGNPLGNIVRKGDKVIVHSATGLDFEVPALKGIAKENKWKEPEKAMAAKIRNTDHVAKMECYACHSAWAPQCYGCHIKVDYSGDKSDTDWVATGNARLADGTNQQQKLMGKASESRSYLRWENPVLGINGEGRVTPVIPGCQQITTVIGPDGKTVINNKIWTTPNGPEYGAKAGLRGLDMAPAAPHTTTREARDCVSCHASSKALGYGTHDGRYMKSYQQGVYAEMMTNTGELLSTHAKYQVSPIPDLPMTLDQIITRDGKQLQTVGSHWPTSGPLTAEQRSKMERVGVCVACHKEVPDGAIAYAILSITGSRLGLIPVTDKEHQHLVGRIMFLASNVEVFGTGAVILLVLWLLVRRKKRP